LSAYDAHEPPIDEVGRGSVIEGQGLRHRTRGYEPMKRRTTLGLAVEMRAAGTWQKTQ